MKKILALALSLLTFTFCTQNVNAQNYKEYDIYVEKPAQVAGNRFFHNAKFEPKTGSYIGIYAEGDTTLHNWNSGSYEDWYFGRVPEVLGKDHAAYLLYVDYAKPDAISHYASHYAAANELGKIMEIALEPRAGLDSVKNDAHLHDLAKQAKEAGVPILLRFANEMNDSSAPWYKDGPEKYKAKFKLVSDIFTKKHRM